MSDEVHHLSLPCQEVTSHVPHVWVKHTRMHPEGQAYRCLGRPDRPTPADRAMPDDDAARMNRFLTALDALAAAHGAQREGGVNPEWVIGSARAER